MRIALAVVLCCFSGAAFSWNTQKDQTPGSMAMAYGKRSNVWSRLDLGVFDGKILTSPPDSQTYDRRLEALLISGFDVAVNQRFGARFNVTGEYEKRRQSEQESPFTTLDSSTRVLSGEIDLTYINHKGLEMFAGLEQRTLFEKDEVVESSGMQTNSTYAKTKIEAYRFGFVRRAGIWTGGFYYIRGGSAGRPFEKEAFDGTTLEGKDTEYILPKTGIFGEFNSGPYTHDFELVFTQGRGNGPEDDQGNSIYTDFLRLRWATLFPVASGGVKVSATHQTLAYSSNAFVTLDTIPSSTMKFLWQQGGASDYMYAGLAIGYGKDKQSEPEFNAQYEFW